MVTARMVSLSRMGAGAGAAGVGVRVGEGDGLGEGVHVGEGVQVGEGVHVGDGEGNHSGDGGGLGEGLCTQAAPSFQGGGMPQYVTKNSYLWTCHVPVCRVFSICKIEEAVVQISNRLRKWDPLS